MKLYSLIILVSLCISCGSSEQPVTSNETVTEAVIDRHEAQSPQLKATTMEQVEEEVEAVVAEVEDEVVDAVVVQDPTAAPEVLVTEEEASTPPALAPVAEPTKVEEKTGPEDEQPILENVPDHSIWQDLLKRHVSATGKVNYKGIQSERAKFQKYLDHLASNPIQSSWSRNQKLAYWINAYNAFTVDLILQNYPLKSIMDLDKPWDKKFIRLGDKTYSLNQIEHEIVRPQFKDARIHFALVCAAASCPKLLNNAYTESKVQAQLDAQTRYFLNKSGKNKLEPNRVAVSQLFNWYGDDFKTSGTIVDYLNQYSEVKIDAAARIEFTEYDWSLNE